MAGQISTSTTRRGVLSELNVNSPLGTASLSAKRQQTIGAESQARSLGEISLHEGVKGREMSETLRQQTGLGATKRNIEAVRGLQVAPGHKSFPHIEEEAQDFKRLKTGRDSESLLKSNRVVRHERHLGSKGDGGRNVSNSPISPLRNELDSGPLLLSASASPASSSASSSQEARDDTQITEPERDESRVIPILTQAELREKAQAMRLRLRLATYKVRTNQIHLPMSRLQIKTTKFDLERLPSPRSKAAKTSRTPLPSAPTSSNIPNILLQKPVAEKQLTNIISSSPPRKFEPTSPTKNGQEEPREEFATPLLPRHRQGLLNPPHLGSPKSPSTDLTSSVVKRGTADVLLSLKIQR